VAGGHSAGLAHSLEIEAFVDKQDKEHLNALSGHGNCKGKPQDPVEKKFFH
jgi:hypothetical protein